VARPPGAAPVGQRDRLHLCSRVEVYPQAAYDKSVQGTVSTQLLIGEEGGVVHVEAIESIAAVDLAVLGCVRQRRFEPTT
jgi:outer membrane biosynthesis protein TonB